MGLYKIKTYLQIKGTRYQSKEAAYRMGENLCQYPSDKELLSRIYKEFKELNTPRTINTWRNVQHL
jgi:hypothetical protein